MKKTTFLTLSIFFFCISLQGFSQEKQIRTDILETLGDFREVYFLTRVPDVQMIHSLTRTVSIDRVDGTTIYAYANRQQFKDFLAFGLDYKILPRPCELVTEKELNMRGTSGQSGPITTWDFYPTYDEYINEMNGFASAHPNICRVVPIGTSNEGRQILAVKISDSLDVDKGCPQVFLTSSIHGDEVTGYVLMLHLIDSLLNGYGQNARITNMVKNFQIFINPLANPDGTYHGGNLTVSNATRTNAFGVDLNRNFPDPVHGPHPDSNPWQTETMAFMRFDTINHFVMSMNFHGGEEVFNYPWDSKAALHADDTWFDFIGLEYADTVHQYGPPSYFIGPNYSGNGVTNGWAWYEVDGGRQDYTTYFHYGREVTLEISVNKMPSASQLPNFWKYNCRSFLNYIEESGFGINGKVTDSVTGLPVSAKVLVLGHDKDNSFVYSNLPSGWYFRPIYQGTYALTFSAPGYFSKTITGVNVINRNVTRLNVKMVPLSIGFVEEISDNQVQVYPNPTTGRVNLVLPETGFDPILVEVNNSLGMNLIKNYVSGLPRISPLTLDLSGLDAGFYILRISKGNQIFERKIILSR